MKWRFILHQNTAPQSLYITANNQAAIHVSENACSLLGPHQDTYTYQMEKDRRFESEGHSVMFL